MFKKLISYALISCILLFAGCANSAEDTTPIPSTTESVVETIETEIITAEPLMNSVEDLLTNSSSIDADFTYKFAYAKSFENFGNIEVQKTHDVKLKQHFKTDSAMIFYSTEENAKNEMFFLVKENDEDILYYSQENDWHRVLEDDYENFHVPSHVAVNELLKNVDHWTVATDTDYFANTECIVALGVIENKNVVSTVNNILFSDYFEEELNTELFIPVKVYFQANTKTLKGVVLTFKDLISVENVEVPNYMISIQYHGFNDINQIVVPDNIKNYCLEKNKIEE